MHAYLAQHCFFLPPPHVPVGIQNVAATSKKQTKKTLACIREIQVHKLWTKVYSQNGLTAMVLGVGWTVGGGEDCASVQQRSGGAGEKYLVFDAFYSSLFLYSLDALWFLIMYFCVCSINLQPFVSQLHIIIALKGGEVQALSIIKIVVDLH